MSTRPIPEHVYKIVPFAPPAPLPDTLPLSELDQNDGFIHLSDAAQIPKTSALFFKAQNTLWLLKVSTKVALAEKGRFKWLDEGVTGCIHLYGEKDGEFARFGRGVVVDVEKWEKGENTDWTDYEVSKEIRERWLKD
jgi:Protein of unknown function (DUF952)